LGENSGVFPARSVFHNGIMEKIHEPVMLCCVGQTVGYGSKMGTSCSSKGMQRYTILVYKTAITYCVYSDICTNIHAEDKNIGEKNQIKPGGEIFQIVKSGRFIQNKSPEIINWGVKSVDPH
jgi:hypothetical protein